MSVRAKSKLQALKSKYDKVYWEGNTPYATNYGIGVYYYKIYAIRVKQGEYTFYSKRIN